MRRTVAAFAATRQSDLRPEPEPEYQQGPASCTAPAQLFCQSRRRARRRRAYNRAYARSDFTGPRSVSTGTAGSPSMLVAFLRAT